MARTVLRYDMDRIDAIMSMRRKPGSRWRRSDPQKAACPGQAAKPAYSADLILSPPGDVHVDGAHHFPVRRNDDPVCNRIRQRPPFVADVASEEKHEDLESKQVADPDLSLECIRGKLFNDRDAEFRRYYRMLSGLPADHEVERQEEPAGLAMYRGSVIPANIRTRIEHQK